MGRADPTPRVAFNLMSARLGGGLTYAISQTRAFLDLWPSDRITLLTSPCNDAAIMRAVSHPTLRLGSSNALHRYLLEQTLPVHFLRKQRIDVFYGIGNFLPLLPGSCRMAMALQNPNYVGEGRHGRRSNGPCEQAKMVLSYASMKRADLVITISHSLEAELRSEPSLRKVRTHVIPSGAPDWDSVSSDIGSSTKLRNLAFLLSVANDYPHKRLQDIAQAFGLASAEIPDHVHLVFAGRITMSEQRFLRATARPNGHKVIFLGSVANRSEIKWLYEHALASISASELEAFPLTPAEAAYLRCPLIMSDIPAHQETARGAGAFFTCGDVPMLAREMTRVAAEGKREPAPAWTWATTWRDNAVRLADALRNL